MKKRIYTSIAIVLSLALLFVLKVYVSDYFFDAFFGVIACIASFEMSRILNKTGRYNFQFLAIFFPSLLLACNMVGVYYAGASKDLYWLLWTILIDLGIIVFAGCATFLFCICRRKSTRNEIKIRELKMSVEKFSFKKTLNTIITFVYPAFLFLFFILINHFNELPLSKFSSISSNASVFILLTAIIIPMITDTFAMLMGSLIGGKKLCPKISPAKTISGSIGGTAWCVLISACIYLVFGCIDAFAPLMEILPIWAYLLIVLFGSIVAQAGDVFESMLKRRAGMKDSGKILPGHGGMLDRIDSYVFMAPYILIALLLLGI